VYKKALLHLLAIPIALGAGFVLSFAQSQPSPRPGVVATVNGVPITEEDLRFASARASAHKMGGRTVDRKELIEGLIREELIYQRAIESGLEADPKYQEDLRKLEAQVKAFKKERLSRIYLQKEIPRLAKVSDAEAREYYDKNSERLRTEFKLSQIFKRNKEQIDQALNELAQKKSFEDVASKGMPKLPAGVNKPWELGYLKWEQLPEPWHKVVLTLKPGEHSGVIQGTNNRFWIIKLIDKREIKGVSFEDRKQSIMKMLQTEKMQGVMEKITREAREKAKITYSK